MKLKNQRICDLEAILADCVQRENGNIVGANFGIGISEDDVNDVQDVQGTVNDITNSRMSQPPIIDAE